MLAVVVSVRLALIASQFHGCGGTCPQYGFEVERLPRNLARPFARCPMAAAPVVNKPALIALYACITAVSALPFTVGSLSICILVILFCMVPLAETVKIRKIFERLNFLWKII
jgi:hypothetical protein